MNSFREQIFLVALAHHLAKDRTVYDRQDADSVLAAIVTTEICIKAVCTRWGHIPISRINQRLSEHISAECMRCGACYEVSGSLR